MTKPAARLSRAFAILCAALLILWLGMLPGDTKDPPVPLCKTTLAGKCKPDGSSITVDADGTIHAPGTGGGTVLSGTQGQIGEYGATGTAVRGATVSGDIAYAIGGSMNIVAHAVANSKLAQMPAHTFKGNNTGSTADALDLSISQLTAELNACTATLKGLVPAPPNDATQFLNGACLWSTPSGSGTVNAGTQGQIAEYGANGSAVRGATVSGDITYALGGAHTITALAVTTGKIAANAVTNPKLAQMGAHTFKGNNTASTADPLDLTATQLTAELNLATASVKGLIPALPNDATKYLDGTGAFSVPPGGGTGCTVPGTANRLLYDTGSACGDLGVSTDGQLIVGQTGALPLWKTLSGDATLSAGGALTIANLAVTTAKINAAAVTYAKMQLGASNGLLRVNSGGAPSEVALGAGLAIVAGALELSTAPTVVGDADCGVLTSAISAVNFNVPLTAARSCTLPAASGMPTWREICFSDVSNGTLYAINGANTVTINRAGSDKIENATSAVMGVGGAKICFKAVSSTAYAITQNMNLGSQTAPSNEYFNALTTAGTLNSAKPLGTVNGIVKANGSGAPSLAVAGTDYAGLGTNQSFTKGQAVTPSALTDGATITPDASLSNGFTVTLGGNRTLANPSNLLAGQFIEFQITQDGTGSRTLAYGNQYKFAGGTAPTLTTTAAAIDVLSCWAATSSRLNCQILADVK